MATSSNEFDDLDDFLSSLDEAVSENPTTKEVDCYLCKQIVEVNLAWRLKRTCDICFEKMRRQYLGASIGQDSRLWGRNTFYDGSRGPYTGPWDRIPGSSELFKR